MTPHQQKAGDLIRIVAAEYGVSEEAISGPLRSKSLIDARCLVYWLLREALEMSYSEVGRTMCRDHTTVMGGIRRFDRRMAESQVFRIITSVVLRKSAGVLDPQPMAAE